MPNTIANMSANFSYTINALNTLIASASAPNALISFNMNGLDLEEWSLTYSGAFTVWNTAIPSGVTAALQAGGSLTIGQPYYYRITAVGPNGYVDPNGPSATVESLGSNEVGVTPTSGNQTVLLSWSPMVGAMSYNIYRGTTSGGEHTLIGDTAATSFTDTGLSGSAGSPPVWSPNYTEFSIRQFVDLSGTDGTFGNVLGFFLVTNGTSSTQGQMAPGESNGFNWFFLGGPSGGIELDTPGALLKSAGPNGSGFPVTATQNTIRFTNGPSGPSGPNGPSGQLYVLIGILGSPSGG